MEMLKRSIIHFHYKVIYLKLIENDNNKQPYKQTSTQTKGEEKNWKFHPPVWVFDNFVELALKGLTTVIRNIESSKPLFLK